MRGIRGTNSPKARGTQYIEPLHIEIMQFQGCFAALAAQEGYAAARSCRFYRQLAEEEAHSGSGCVYIGPSFIAAKNTQSLAALLQLLKHGFETGLVAIAFQVGKKDVVPALLA